MNRYIVIFLILCLQQACLAFSSDHLEYEHKFYDYSTIINEQVGVAVIAYNRPQYLKKLIKSIEVNEESKILPFFFFLDGGSFSKQKESAKLIEDSKISNKNIIFRNVNYGLFKNHVDAKRFMFDWCNFKKLIVFEEDLKISRFYFKTLLNLDKWAHNKFANISTVQLWTSDCILSKDEKKKALRLVRRTRPNYSLVTYCLRKDAWNTISEYMYEFEKKFLDPIVGNDKYSLSLSKPSQGIYINEIHTWIKKASNAIRQNKNKFNKNKINIPPAIFNNINANQDQLTSYLLSCAGFARLQTVVNRVEHIGDIGSLGYKRQDKSPILQGFGEDKTLTNFYYIGK